MNPSEPRPAVASGPHVSVVVPTYNERECIAALYPRLASALAGVSAELVVVDDRSPDGTAAVARSLTGPLPVVVLERAGKFGLASAVLDGFARARGDVLIVMDADGSHPPEEVPALIRALDGGAEFVLGSRWVPGGSAPGLTWWRRLISSGARLLARPVAPVNDSMSGFFGLRRGVLARAPLTPVGYKIGLEILVKCRPHPVVEVPLIFGPRIAGESKLGSGEVGNYLRHVGRLYVWALFGRRRASSTR